MHLLPRSRRGTWLLAGAAWCAASAGFWWALPVVPRAEISHVRGATGFTADGERFFCHNLQEKEPLRVWSVQTGERLLTWAPAGQLLVFEPRLDLALVNTGNKDSPCVSLIDLASGKSERVKWWSQSSRGVVHKSSDGRYFVLALSWDSGEKTVWWDRQSGKTIGEFADLTPIDVAPDGRWVTARHDSTELALRAPASLTTLMNYRRNGPWTGVSFAAGGQLIVQDFDVAEFIDPCTGEVRARFPTAQPLLLPEIGQVVYTNFTDGMLQLSRWDLDSAASLGTEVVAQSTSDRHATTATVLTTGGRFLISYEDTRRVTPFASWFAKLPLAKSFFGDHSTIYALYDARDGAEVMRFQPSGHPTVQLSPNGQTIATLASVANIAQIWDIPPRKSLIWFALGAAVLALPIALLAWRRTRRLRAA